MLSYCVNIVFYLLLKAEGRPVGDHPVVLRLVEIRTYLESSGRWFVSCSTDRQAGEDGRPAERTRGGGGGPARVPAKPGRAREQGGRGRRGGRRGRRTDPRRCSDRHGGRVRGGGRATRRSARKGRREARQQVRAIKVRGAEARMGWFFFPLRGSAAPRKGAPTRPERNPDSTTWPSLPRSSAAFVGVLFHGDRRRPFLSRLGARTRSWAGYRSNPRATIQSRDGHFSTVLPSRERPLRCRPPSVSRARALR